MIETASLLLPASRGAMTWRVGDNGFEMTLSSELPALIGSCVRGWCEKWLGHAGVGLGDIAAWAIHPGGRTVLDAVERAFALPPDALDVSREVLRRYGNMSSGTVMFVLAEMLRKAVHGAKGCAMAFGPGLTAETMLFRTAG